MRVLALTKYGPMAASTRQRFLLYRPYLAEHGIDIDVAPLIGDDDAARSGVRGVGLGGLARGYAARAAVLMQARRYDLLWVQYDLFPFLPGLFERWGTRSGTPIVVDFDDAIFHLYDRHPKPRARRLLGDKFRPLLTAAAACVCGNAYLRDYAARFCRHSVIVPTVVDTDVYVPAREVPPAALPTIGWLGSRTTWQNVEPILPTVLAKVHAGRAGFRVVGAGPPAEGRDGIDAAEWSEASEVAELQAMDIGIMPLIDAPFQRGKCGYKLIQYMACGVATIASPVGVNSDIVVDGATGLLASGEGEWSAALDRLLDEPGLRVQMGQRGRDIAVDRFSLAAHRPRLLRLLTAAAQGDRATLAAMSAPAGSGEGHGR